MRQPKKKYKNSIGWIVAIAGFFLLLITFRDFLLQSNGFQTVIVSSVLMEKGATVFGISCLILKNIYPINKSKVLYFF